MQSNLPRVQNVSCVFAASTTGGGLYIGNYFGAQNVEILKQYGIRAVLTTSVQTPIVYAPEDIPFHKRIEAHDNEAFSLTEHFDQCMNFIEEHRKVTNVFVHCYAGMSRSAAVIIAYLMKEYQWNYDLALNFLKHKRSIVNPNEGFVQQLKAFQKVLKGNQWISTVQPINNPYLQKQIVASETFPQYTSPQMPIKQQYVVSPEYQQTYQPPIYVNQGPYQSQRYNQFDIQKQPQRQFNNQHIFSQTMPLVNRYTIQPTIANGGQISGKSQIRMTETISAKSGIRYHEQIPIPKFGSKINAKDRTQTNKNIVQEDKKSTTLRSSKTNVIRPRDLPGYRIS